MSVPLSQRSQSDLQVLYVCENLVKYTLQKVSNEKVFPKRQRWIMSQKIANEILDCYADIRRANSVLVRCDDDFRLRRKYQEEARSRLGAFLGLLDVAYVIFGIEDSVCEYWTGLAVQTEELLTGWMNSDLKRYHKE